MGHRDSEPEGLLPLTPAVFHILLALTGGRLHGYGIMKEAERVSEGQMQMGPGTLYGTLKRLLEEGLIEETEAPADEPEDNRPRRYYRLTDAGRRVLEAEIGRMEQLVAVARRRRLFQGGV